MPPTFFDRKKGACGDRETNGHFFASDIDRRSTAALWRDANFFKRAHAGGVAGGRLLFSKVSAGAPRSKCEVAHTSPPISPSKMRQTRTGTRTGTRRGTWHRNQNQNYL